MMGKFAFRRHWVAGIAGLLLIAVAAAVPWGAAAQGAEQDPGAFIQSLGNQAIQVMGPSVSPAQRFAIFRQLLSADFDLPDAARFVLGPYGRAMSPPQHQQFMALFRDTLAQSYSERLAQYAGEPFRVTGVRQLGGETIVGSEVSGHGGPPVRLDWHVINRDGRFLITDVSVDGVSQRTAQRSEFAGIIQRNGGQPDALLAALRQQLAQGAPTSSGSSYPPQQQLPPLPPGYRPLSPPASQPPQQ